jgi:hypothetical protein
MSQKTDWFPTTRAGILAMAIVWIAVCTVKRLLWGIAGVALTEFAALKDAAVSFQRERNILTLSEGSDLFSASPEPPL